MEGETLAEEKRIKSDKQIFETNDNSGYVSSQRDSLCLAGALQYTGYSSCGPRIWNLFCSSDSSLEYILMIRASPYPNPNANPNPNLIILTYQHLVVDSN